jgi:hypothetical protein
VKSRWTLKFCLWGRRFKLKKIIGNSFFLHRPSRGLQLKDTILYNTENILVVENTKYVKYRKINDIVFFYKYTMKCDHSGTRTHKKSTILLCPRLIEIGKKSTFSAQNICLPHTNYLQMNQAFIRSQLGKLYFLFDKKRSLKTPFSSWLTHSNYLSQRLTLDKA